MKNSNNKEFEEIVSEVSNGFSMLSDIQQGRATHTHGVVASGVLDIVSNPMFPEHPLLKAGAQYQVLLRHASVKGKRDDAVWDARGATLRIAFKTETGQLCSHDILMNTGTTFPTGTAADFYEWFVASPQKRCQIVEKNKAFAESISGAIRNPGSYLDLRYYSQIAFLFKGSDGMTQYAKFRLLSADGREETGFIDTSLLEPGTDFVPRQPRDVRSTKYLRDDFTHRVTNDNIAYRLEIQLHEIVKGDYELLDCSKEWDEKLSPWYNVGTIYLSKILPTEEMESLSFSLSNTHEDLSLVLSSDAHHPASLANLRTEVYNRASEWRNRPAPTDLKELYVYRGKAGIDLPTLAPTTRLPPMMYPSPRYLARFGLYRLPEALPASPPEPLLGIMGVTELMGSNFTKWMPSNPTRLNPNKYSDSFFCERRLNGFNAGKLNRVYDQQWQYETRYDTSVFKKESGGLLPDRICARFVLDGNQLQPHSIEIEAGGHSKKVTPHSNAEDWEMAKKHFRSTEFIFQEMQSHLARCHMNVEQYAMAFYRNIDQNPIKELLDPHFEGTMYINKAGTSLIAGPNGIIAVASPIDHNAVDTFLHEEIARLSWRWTPMEIALPDYIHNNHYDRASRAMWNVIRQYVRSFFAENKKSIEELWSEIKNFSDDLCKHSILEPQYGKLEIKNISELEQVCTYVIYHATFAHSWTNEKQWDDGCDPEYTPLGLWDENHPDVKPERLKELEAAQVRLGWNLSRVHYNPIMENGPDSLRRLLFLAKDEINPGLPIESIMMSINI